jgi:hypothetical protein
MPIFRRLTLDELTITDEASFRHVGLYDELKQALRRDGVRFRVPLRDARAATWDRALFLNLTFWSPTDEGDVLVDEHVPADVVAHAAWHHVASARLHARGVSTEASLLAESIASAFDLYLVGRLLGHAPSSDFLATQVPAISDVAASAGLSDDAIEAMLASVSADPDRAFEDMRSLLFDATTALVQCATPEAAAEVLERLDARPFAPLLHHFELSNWVLASRRLGAEPAADATAREVDAALRAAPVALDWLEANWLA